MAAITEWLFKQFKYSFKKVNGSLAIYNIN